MFTPAPFTSHPPASFASAVAPLAAAEAEQAEIARLLAGHAGRLALRIAIARWDRAVRILRASGYVATRQAFDLACEWRSAALDAGLGRVDAPIDTAYPAEWQERAA